MYFKRSIEVQVGQQYFMSYHMFDAIKHVIGSEVLLAYLDFNAQFEIHADTSKLKIGAVIPQKGKLIAFFHKRQNYTTTEK